jgi:polysaccharide deacetylase 2 family uncharacterized protein YibQ
VNSSLLAGLGVGSGLVLLGFVGATVVFPPQPGPVAPPLSDSISQPAPASPEPELADPELAAPEITEPEITEPEIAEPESPVPDLAAEPDTTPETDRDAPSDAPDPDSALTEAAPEPEIPAEDSTAAPLPDMPEEPNGTAELAEDSQPAPPSAEITGPQARLPSSMLPTPGREAGQGLPQVTVPQLPSSDAASPPASDAPAADDSDSAALTEAPPATLPGTRISGLPQIGAGDPAAPDASAEVPAPEAAAVPALERNSLYDGASTGARMALVLSDPGLPMAMRRALAALDFPVTIALNPLDSTAPEAAAIYTGAGKEVLILAASIPEGATASDLDVTFNAYFASLPMAVGVIDLPQTGFARNARLLNEVLPLLQQDGHGLVTFSGGLAQATRAASAAGVPHAEVFRVIDSGNDSAFTMRRFLDRAVFQASQMGQVIVFGDASNDVLMEAITMWREGSRLDQVALVPVSGILRNLP